MALFFDLLGTTISAEEREILRHPLVSGVVLFTRNFCDVEQLRLLVADLKALKPSLLITVDQEGGRVQRFRPGFVTLPALGQIGQGYEQDENVARAMAKTHAWLMASEILSTGIDLSFAPVLDLNFPHSEIIHHRAFHPDPIINSDLANHYIQTLHQVGMAATGKHFPGHGHVVADSHKTLPRDQRSLQEIKSMDLIPFHQAIVHGLDAIMTAHIVFENIDSQPATFSRFWLQEILRDTLHFKGIIFSDDLAMQGACYYTDPIERVMAAMNAGCDIILFCNDRHNQCKLLDQLKVPTVQPNKLQPLYARKKLEWSTLHASREWQERVDHLTQWIENCHE